MEEKEVMTMTLRYRNLLYKEQIAIRYSYYSELNGGTYPTKMEKVARKLTFEEANREDAEADKRFAIWLKKYFNEH